MRTRPDALWLASAASAILVVVPIAFIIFLGYFVYRSPIGWGTEVLRSIELSLISSAAAAGVDVVVFTPISYYLARVKSTVLESMTDIPASIPHPVVGIALLAIDSPVTPVGRELISLGINFFDTLQGITAALVIVSAPIYIRAMQTHFQARRLEPEWFASQMGASRAKVLYSVVLPEARRELVSSALTSMSRALSEFGSIAIVAYYVLQPPFSGVEPASVLIYQYYGYYGPQAAFTAAATMILFSVPVMLAARLALRR